MTNTSKSKKLVAMQILFMLATSALTVNFAHAEISESAIPDPIKGDKVQLVVSEKIIDGKLKLRYFGILGDLQTIEIQEILSVKGIRTNWIYSDGEAFNSGIILYNGKSLNFKNPDVNEKGIELSYQIIFSAKSSKNPETKFVIIMIDTEPKNAPQHQKSNLVSHF